MGSVTGYKGCRSDLPIRSVTLLCFINNFDKISQHRSIIPFNENEKYLNLKILVHTLKASFCEKEENDLWKYDFLKKMP